MNPSLTSRYSDRFTSYVDGFCDVNDKKLDFLSIQVVSRIGYALSIVVDTIARVADGILGLIALFFFNLCLGKVAFFGNYKASINQVRSLVPELIHKIVKVVSLHPGNVPIDNKEKLGYCSMAVKRHLPLQLTDQERLITSLFKLVIRVLTQEVALVADLCSLVVFVPLAAVYLGENEKWNSYVYRNIRITELLFIPIIAAADLGKKFFGGDSIESDDPFRFILQWENDDLLPTYGTPTTSSNQASSNQASEEADEWPQ